MKKTDIGVVGFMYAVCILFLSMTLKLKKGAQTYPIFIISLLAALTTLYLIQMIVGAKKNGVTSGAEDFEGFLPCQFFPLLGMIIGYLVVMYFVGFYISTITFMILSLLYLKISKIKIIITTIVLLLIVYGAFTMFLGVNLPMGLIFK